MNVCSTTPQVLVVTSEGYFYQFNIDLENGGECVLLKQNRQVTSILHDDLCTDIYVSSLLESGDDAMEQWDYKMREAK